MSRLNLVIVGGAPEDWGIIPSFLNVDDPRPAKQQIDQHYVSGWHEIPGFTFDPETLTLQYREDDGGDPPMRPLSMMIFRNERLMIYESAWVVIVQPDDSWVCARLD